MKVQSAACLVILCVLPGFLFARPYGEGPASRTETFYQALASGDIPVAEACVHPDDRSTLAVAAAVAQWYAPCDPQIALKSSVLSWINPQGMAVYWYEPVKYAKVLLDSGDSRRFVFVLELVGSEWYIRLDRNALGFMMDTRKAGVDPDSLRTSGRRTPGFQAREFIRSMSTNDFSQAQRYVARESRNLFSLLSLFQEQFQAAARQEIRVLDESARDSQARVELELGTGKRVVLSLVLQEGEWLVTFDR